MNIIPGILTDSKDVFGEQLRMAAASVEWIQIDFLDGVYADNKTITPWDLQNFRNEFFDEQDFVLNDTMFEAHLMVGHDNVESWVRQCQTEGFDRIMVQIESIEDQQWYYDLADADEQYEVGVSIDAETPIAVIDDVFLSKVDVIQVMTIKAGFQGQSFMPEMMDKVAELASLRQERSLEFLIEVDGGVKIDLIPSLEEAGVDLAVVGSGLFGGGDFNQNLTKLHEVMK